MLKKIISHKADNSTGRVIKCGQKRKMRFAATGTQTSELVTVRSLDINKKDKIPLAIKPQQFIGIAFILTRRYKSIYELHQQKMLLWSSLPSSLIEHQCEEKVTSHTPYRMIRMLWLLRCCPVVTISCPRSTHKRWTKAFRPLSMAFVMDVSDTHHNAKKYLMCLAANMPVVPHMWVHDCCKQN